MTGGLDPLGQARRVAVDRISAARDGQVSYIYFGEHQPDQWTMGLPLEDGDYEVDLIDPWKMTVTP